MNRTSFLLTFSLCLVYSLIWCDCESCFEPWGFDEDLCKPNVQILLAKPKKSVTKRGCLACIHFFQYYISPIDGPRSSFYPTSSQYAADAIEKYGMLKGIALGCDRLMRENEEMWVYGLVEKHGYIRKYDPVR